MRNLELLDSSDRNDMDRALTARRRSPRGCDRGGGERCVYDVHAMNVGSGSAGIAIDASEATALRAALERMAEAHRAHPRSTVVRRGRIRCPAPAGFYNDSYRRCGIWTARSSMATRTIRACSIGCAPRARFRNSRTSGLEGEAA